MHRRRFRHRLHGAHSVHRREYGRPPVFAGVALVSLGVLYLLDGLNVVEARVFMRTYWPALIVAFGAARVVSGRGGERVIGGGAMAFGGVLLANRVLGWDVRVWSLLWPSVLIALGAYILFHAYRPAPIVAASDAAFGAADATDADETPSSGDDRVDTTSTIREFAVMAHIDRRNVSQTFRGGQITAVMGGIEIDLRECRMAANEAIIDMSIVMGGVELRIPRDWTVESRLSLVLAGLDDGSSPPVDESTKRLIIQGKAFMGGVEIRN